MERPLPGQILSMTLLVSLAWLPLIANIKPWPNVYLGFLLILRLASLRWPALAPGRWLLLPLTLVGMAGVFSAYGSLVGPEAGTAFLATMLALKLLEMRRLRDLRVGSVLFGFLLVSQFLLDQSATRALYLVLLLVLDLALMADLTARRGRGREALLCAVRTAARLSLQALPLTLILFFLFPRLSVPLWSLPQQPDKGYTGMSGWMEPGSVNELALSTEPAFRVRFDGPIPPVDRMYWRGPVAWHNDGQRWTGWTGAAPLGKPQPLAAMGEEISYQVDLEPSGKGWLFTLDIPIRVSGDTQILGDFQVITARRVDGKRSYRAMSALRYDTGGLDLAQKQAGTRLTDNITPRMRALVDGWWRDAATKEEIVSRALRFFHEEPFFYSLSPPRLGPNHTDGFLFETRRGFCEHYADSFATLMRIAGIPSRVVLGYLGGELNPVGGYLLVRQSDAHAWVEVWLDGKGWVRVDPTAAIDPERVDLSSLPGGLGSVAPLRFRMQEANVLGRWIHDLGLLGDAIESGWYNWVIGLSNIRQQRMLDSLGLGSLKEYGLTLALILAAAVVLGLLLLSLTRPLGPRDPLERIYVRFCKRLSRIGLPRGIGEGPLAYSRRVIRARPDLRGPIESFVDLYLPLRYGSGKAHKGYGELARRLGRLRPGCEPRR